jgi:hypothetical protein
MNLFALVAGWGVPAKLVKPLIYGVLVVLVLGALWGGKCAYDKSVIDSHEAKIEQRAKPATDQAATERAQETIAIQQHEQEMHNAIAAAPDQPIAPSSHVRACEQLRRAHRHSPSCRGPAGSH